jgi:hypothetical protein
MVDYYGLPASGQRAWPGRAQATSPRPAAAKGQIVAAALAKDVAAVMSWTGSSQVRFVPFVVMHEFEGLLFSDCQRFAVGIGRPSLAADFQTIRDRFESPEDINDSTATAPSKRVEGIVPVPGYQKRLFGVQGALEMGIATIRSACPHFASWLTTLEKRVESAR